MGGFCYHNILNGVCTSGINFAMEELRWLLCYYSSALVSGSDQVKISVILIILDCRGNIELCLLSFQRNLDRRVSFET